MQRIRLNFLPVHLCPPLGRAVALSQLEVSGKSRGKVALRRLLAQRLVVVHGGKGEEGRFMYTWRVVQLGWCLGCHASRGLGGCLGGCLGGFPGRQLAFALPLGTPLLVGLRGKNKRVGTLANVLCTEVWCSVLYRHYSLRCMFELAR